MISDYNTVATVQVDIDSLAIINDAYAIGIQLNQAVDAIIQHTIPIYLDLFNQLNICATFFIVGKDLENRHNVKAFQSIVDSGHEIANHSFSHNGFDRMSTDEKLTDIKKSHDIIFEKTGVTCKGFKAPGYCLDGDLLKILISLQYEYDASLIGTILSPIMKMYYFCVLQRKIHPSNYGYLFHITAPSIPFIPDAKRPWREGRQPIVEIPVTTMPYLKLPIHFSFINLLGIKIFALFWHLSNLSRLSFLNFAFHAADLIPPEILPKVFYSRPGLSRGFQQRLNAAHQVLERIKTHYTVKNSREVAYMTSTQKSIAEQEMRKAHGN